jgi:hypothetical protein
MIYTIAITSYEKRLNDSHHITVVEIERDDNEDTTYYALNEALLTDTGYINSSAEVTHVNGIPYKEWFENATAL